MKDTELKFVNVTSIHDDLEWLRSKVYYTTNDSLKHNYSKERFYKDDILFSTIIYRDDMPVEGSTVITRDIFKGGARVLNRLITVPEERNNFQLRIGTTCLKMLKSQLEFASQHFNYAFTSRELNTYRFMKRFAEDANAFMDFKWNYKTDKHLVCNPAIDNCWQYIAWTEFTDLDTFPLQSQSSYLSDIHHH